MFKRIISAVFCLFLLSSSAVSQDERPIELTNASFEDMPRPQQPPYGWWDCGFNGETPPDTHPVPGDPSFGVTKEAQNGNTYLGMVVRENETWESVAQRLTKPLEADKCYSFSIYLARSTNYVSSIKGKMEQVNFSTPIKLRVWGGTGFCNKKELLDESSLVKNVEWEEYHFKFSPKQRHTYIVFEAFFQTPAPVPPNGNILLDNASAITPLPCDEDAQPIVKVPEVNITNPPGRSKKVKKSTFNLIANVLNVKEKREILLKVNGKNKRNFSFDPLTNKVRLKLDLIKGANEITIRASNRAGKANDATIITYEPPANASEPVATAPPVKPDPPKQASPRKTTKYIDLKPGETLKIDQLYFDIDSYELKDASIPSLEEVYQFMKENRNVRVEIGGHTNQNCDTEYCNKLSTSRAKSVVDYLKSRGVSSDRLKYKGYGKTKPKTWANNSSAQKKNQRVEIKILSLGG